MDTGTDETRGARGAPLGNGTPAGQPTGAVNPARDPGVADDVRGVVQAAVEALTRAGTVSAAGVTDGLEGAGRSLSRRVVADAAGVHREMADRDALARALADKPRVAALGSATSAAMAIRFASRFRRLGFFAKRTPAFMVATAVPALIASVTRGANELGMVASHLTHRARATGVEPDLERVRRAAVQIVSRQAVDPEVEPSHGALALQWLKRAVRAALPFTAGVATADPQGLATAAAAVDVTLLGAA
jgi:hypothetical protein